MPIDLSSLAQAFADEPQGTPANIHGQNPSNPTEGYWMEAEEAVIDNDGKKYLTGYSVDLHYVDGAYSEIKLDKSIVVDKSQVNLTRESNSQAIPFKMPRYWDGIDLATMNIAIHYFTSYVVESGSTTQYLEGAESPINVYCDDDNIYFIWLISESVTAKEGPITFEIVATGEHNNRKYIWRTKPNNQLTVIKGLNIASSTSQVQLAYPQSFLESLNQIKDEIISMLGGIGSGEGESGSWNDLVKKTEFNQLVKNYLDENVKDNFVKSGEYSNGVITLTFENDTSITIEISDLVNGLVTTENLKDYYTINEIGTIPPKNDGTAQTLVAYIDSMTSGDESYATKDDINKILGEVPKTAEGKDQTFADYIGKMDDSFYQWIVDFKLVNKTYEDYTYMSCQGDGSEFFGDLAKSGNDFFNLYSEISINQTGLTEESSVQQALDNLVGVEPIYEKNNSLLELFNITDSTDKAGLIKNYNDKETGLRDKFNNKIIQIKLGYLIQNAPTEEKFYKISAPVTLSTNPITEDTITFTEVPVSKQDYSKADSIVKYVNALENRLNDETILTRSLSNDIKVLNDNVIDLVNITNLLNADAETEGSIDWKIAQADISDKLNDYYTKDEINDDIIGDTKGESVVNYVDAAVASVDVSKEFGELEVKIADTYATKTELTTAIQNLDIISEEELLTFIEEE